MFKISINKNCKLEDIDALYTLLYSYTRQNLTVDLMLPIEVKSSYVGIIPSLYQFVFTWMRYEKSGKLLIDIADPTKTDFDELYENELIFPLVSLVWNTNEIFNNSGEINLRNYLKESNVRYFNKMKAVEAQKNRKLLLTNFDHLPEERGILPCFEINRLFVADETKLSNSLSNGIQQVLIQSKNAQREFEAIKAPLMGIIYELMKNTFEWGNKDESNVPLDPNMRGLLIKFYNKGRNNLLDEFKYHKGLLDFFKSPSLKENANAGIYFLEIDVFDSGVGFSRKYKALNPSEKLSDIEIIKKCLIKHTTSAKGLEKDDKGIGLDRILNILDGRGFLRIKTGNNCVYRNLISNPYIKVDKNNVSAMELFDWKTNSNNAYTKYQQAEGSVITIIYPLSFEI